MAKPKLTKAQLACLAMMDVYGRISQNASGRWSRYPHGGFNSRTIWDLEERGLCQRSINHRAQITEAGRSALSSTEGDKP